MCGSDVFLGLIAILFPPFAVWVKRGICSADSLINIALCCLGFLPGLLHAWYIITVTPDPAYSELSDAEGGRVTYYYIPQDQTTPQHHQPRTEQAGYGTVDPSRTPQYGPSNQGPATGSADVGAGEETPPTYQQAVGDRKVQGS